MTKPEARKIARQLSANGFCLIRIIEDFDTGEMSVSALNRCNMRRSVESVQEGADLIRFEGRKS